MTGMNVLLLDFWEKVVIAKTRSGIGNPIEAADTAVAAWRERWAIAVEEPKHEP